MSKKQAIEAGEPKRPRRNMRASGPESELGTQKTSQEKTRSPARWRRRAAARPEEILDAALALFAQHGFTATKMEQVAQRAGVSKGTVYLYFENKEALLRGLVKRSILPHVAGVLEAARISPLSPPEKLQLVCQGAAAVVSRDEVANLAKVIIAEAGAYPEFARFYRQAVIDPGHAVVGEIIEQGIARGDFAPCDTRLAARLFISPIIFIAIWRSSFGRHEDNPLDPTALAQLHGQLFANGLMGLTGKTKS